MATHFSALAWRIPGTAEPGGYRLWGCTELDTTEVTYQEQQQQQQQWLLSSPDGTDGKESARNVGHLGLIPG